MNPWASKRKRNIFLVVFLALVILIGTPVYFVFFNKTPTCSDGKMNGGETGIDCGGGCQLICTAESLPLLTVGDPRILPVGNGNYTVVVQVENPNVGSEVKQAGYTIKVYEEGEVVPVKTIGSVTYAPRDSQFVIFEGPFPIGSRMPNRAVFAWNTDMAFEKTTVDPVDLSIKNKVLTRETTEPKLSATVANDSFASAKNIELVALMYNVEGNIIAASRTIVDSLDGRSETPVVFTWPAPFIATSTTSAIIPRVFPDPLLLR